MNVIFAILAYTPRILLNRIAHTKNVTDESFTNQSQQVRDTVQTMAQRNSQPKILLQRVALT